MKLLFAPRWLAVATCLVIYVILSLAWRDGWLAKAVPLGEPYLGQCQAVGVGFRCTTQGATLKAIVAPIRLKARHDYLVTISGRSLRPDPVRIFVDFYGGKDYDAPAQKGIVILREGAAQRFVLRWPSDLPPAQASFRISNADAADFAIESVHIARLSSGLARTADLVLAMGLLLLLHALWRDRHALLALRAPKFAGMTFTSTGLRALLLIVAGVAALLLVRVSVMGMPMVFGDEMTYALLSASLGDPMVYSHNSLLLPLPNQLFFDLYHLATLCGDAMLAVARAMNSIVFALAAIPIFGLSRRFLPERQALAFAAFVILLPTSAYTSFFMPESLYFLAFWFVAWAFVVFIEPGGRTRHAALAGLALAALSLVKPHGLTILLACNLVLLIAVCAWSGERQRIARGWLVLLLVFVCSRSVLGISAAPETDDSWLDRMLGMYANMLSHTMQASSDAQALEQLRLAVITNVGPLLLLFGPPLVLGIGWLLRRRTREECVEARAIDRLHLFTLVAMACLLIGTIKFTAAVAPIEGSGRIHQRYYDFAFGLILLSACASVQMIRLQGLRLHRRMLIALVPIAAIAVWYLTHEFQTLQPESAHHPTLAAFWTSYFNGGSLIAYAMLISLVLMPWGPRLASRLYALCLAVICVGGFFQTWHRGLNSQVPQIADRAAAALKSLYEPAQLDHGLIVAETGHSLCRTAFHLRDNAFVRILPTGSSIDVGALAPGAEWVLTYGHYDLAGWEPRLNIAGDVTLYQRSASRSVSQSAP